MDYVRENCHQDDIANSHGNDVVEKSFIDWYQASMTEMYRQASSKALPNKIVRTKKAPNIDATVVHNANEGIKRLIQRAYENNDISIAEKELLETLINNHKRFNEQLKELKSTKDKIQAGSNLKELLDRISSKYLSLKERLVIGVKEKLGPKPDIALALPSEEITNIANWLEMSPHKLQPYVESKDKQTTTSPTISTDKPKPTKNEIKLSLNSGKSFSIGSIVKTYQSIPGTSFEVLCEELGLHQLDEQRELAEVLILSDAKVPNFEDLSTEASQFHNKTDLKKQQQEAVTPSEPQASVITMTEEPFTPPVDTVSTPVSSHTPELPVQINCPDIEALAGKLGIDLSDGLPTSKSISKAYNSLNDRKKQIPLLTPTTKILLQTFEISVTTGVNGEKVTRTVDAKEYDRLLGLMAENGENQS